MRVLNRCLLGAGMLLFGSHAGVATATPLNLVLPEFPDVLAQFIDVNYATATGAFTASGVPLQISAAPGTTFTFLNGTFNIAITTDGTTSSGSAGDDLNISGQIDVDGDGVADAGGVMLQGELAAFGASASGPGVFEFIFDLTGGLLSNVIPLFPPGQVGVILGADGGSTFTGSFAVDFTNLTGGLPGSGTGSADTAPIPEPTTVLLLGSGIAGLVGFGRRTRR